MGMRVVVAPDGRRFAEECECRQTRKLSYAFHQCRIPPKYEDATLESYESKFPGADASLGFAHLVAKRFADDYPAMMTPGRGLMFSGSSGLGKTHLAVGILKVLNAEVLVLDDLGSVKPTDWVWDMVSMVLNTRYNQKRMTIVTTNFENLPAGSGGAGMTLGDRIGDRMRSRLLEMCREVKMQGADYRESFAQEEVLAPRGGRARRG
jgi:DNA replication protein DnaC